MGDIYYDRLYEQLGDKFNSIRRVTSKYKTYRRIIIYRKLMKHRRNQ